MVAVGGVAAGLGHACGRIGKKVDDILMQDRSLGLQREQIVATAGDDPLSDVGLGPDASMVTSAAVKRNRSTSSGMAVIANGSFTSAPAVRNALNSGRSPTT